MLEDAAGTGPEWAGAAPRRPARGRPPWVGVAAGAPYFVLDDGTPWTPVGYNDAITWPELAGLFRRRDLAGVEAHLRMLRGHGVSCIRLMLEYAQVRHRYFERPAGTFPAAMVRLWDDLFALCERTGMRILLTPFDTFWTWLHWRHHPYNRLHGGPLDHPSRILLCDRTRAAIKARLSFAVRRWGGSGTLFAWDLWNEIHPAQGGDSADAFMEFIEDVSGHVRWLEVELYGRSHPQTVSLFGPELVWRPHMPLAEPIFRHPSLDVATLHVYEQGTIDDPRDTVAPALAMARIVAGAIAEIADGRPFLDTEHGPIHTFKDRRKTLPERFDDEYFRHMQWAHLAAGGAGGGMRWPNRRPHVLTVGMRRAQKALSDFLPLVDWPRFDRRVLREGLTASHEALHLVACGDRDQAVVWAVRGDSVGTDGTLRPDVAPLATDIRIPGLSNGTVTATLWDTDKGRVAGITEAKAESGMLILPSVPVARDIAIAVGRKH
jgi:mannan endo-1,4-beta-mannosidase